MGYSAVTVEGRQGEHQGQLHRRMLSGARAGHLRHSPGAPGRWQESPQGSRASPGKLIPLTTFMGQSYSEPRELMVEAGTTDTLPQVGNISQKEKNIVGFD